MIPQRSTRALNGRAIETNQTLEFCLLSFPALKSWTRSPSFPNKLLYASQESEATATRLRRARLIFPPSPAAQLLSC